MREIEEIYNAYPRKEDRRKALDAISAAIRNKKITAHDLLARVKTYALSRHGKDAKFTPLPATWMNKERWADTDINTNTKDDHDTPDWLSWTPPAKA